MRQADRLRHDVSVLLEQVGTSAPSPRPGGERAGVRGVALGRRLLARLIRPSPRERGEGTLGALKAERQRAQGFDALRPKRGSILRRPSGAAGPFSASRAPLPSGRRLSHADRPRKPWRPAPYAEHLHVAPHGRSVEFGDPRKLGQRRASGGLDAPHEAILREADLDGRERGVVDRGRPAGGRTNDRAMTGRFHVRVYTRRAATTQALGRASFRAPSVKPGELVRKNSWFVFFNSSVLHKAFLLPLVCLCRRT